MKKRHYDLLNQNVEPDCNNILVQLRYSFGADTLFLMKKTLISDVYETKFTQHINFSLFSASLLIK